MDTHLDLLDLLKDAKCRLTEKAPESLLALDADSLTRLLSGQSISCLDTIKEHFAPIFIQNKETQETYPLFYLKTETDDQGRIRKGHDLPIFNVLAFSFLTSLGIEMRNYSRIDDLNSYLFSLRGSLENRKLRDKVGIFYALGFVDDQTLLANASYNSLNENLSFLYSETMNPAIEEEIRKTSQSDSGSEFDVAVNRFEKYRFSKVSCHSLPIQKEFLIRLIHQEVPKSKSILFVIPKERRAAFDEFIRDHQLETFTASLKNINLFNLIPLREKHEEPLKPEVRKALWNLRENQRKYCDLHRLERSFSSFPKAASTAENLEYYIKGLREKHDIRLLDIGGYTSDDYDRDHLFLSAFDSFTTIRNSYLSNHPCFGLSCSGKHENYDALELLLIKLSHAVKDFEDSLKEGEIVSFGGKPLLTFADFSDYGKDMTLLSGYNGFPRRYFHIKNEDEIKHSLDDLQKRYQALSSSRLLVANIFHDSIFHSDIEALLAGVHSAKFSVRLGARKEIRAQLKSRYHRHFAAALAVLETYQKSQTNVNSVLPDYLQTYGESVGTMNGVVEIQSNIRYIESFLARTAENPDFSLENPVIKKAMREKAYRQSLLAAYRKSSALLAEVRGLFNKYVGYFYDDPLRLEKLSFADLHRILKTKQRISYDEFLEYATFQEKLKSASILLQLTVRNYQASQRPLSDFVKEYQLSLFLSFYEKGQHSTDDIRQALDKFKVGYLSDLYRYPKLMDDFRKELFSSLIASESQTPNYQETYHLLQEKKAARAFSYPECQKSLSLYSQLFPLMVVASTETYLVAPRFFEEVIVLDAESLSTSELLNAMQIGKHVLLLSDGPRADVRTIGFPETVFSGTAFGFSFLPLSSLPESFLDLLRNEASKQGFDLLMKREEFPLCLAPFGSDKPKIALLPDILIPAHFAQEAEVDLREYLMDVYSLQLIIIDTFSFLVKPEETFRSYIRQLTDAEQKEEKNEMTFVASELFFSSADAKKIFTQETAKIAASFPERLSVEQVKDLLILKEYADAFEGIEPVRETTVNALADGGFLQFLRKKTAEGSIVLKNGFYQYASVTKILFHKATQETRPLKEMSDVEFCQGLKAFVFSFESFPVEELRKQMASLCGVSPSNPEFLYVFQHNLQEMADKERIVIHDDRVMMKLN